MTRREAWLVGTGVDPVTFAFQAPVSALVTPQRKPSRAPNMPFAFIFGRPTPGLCSGHAVGMRGFRSGAAFERFAFVADDLVLDTDLDTVRCATALRVTPTLVARAVLRFPSEKLDRWILAIGTPSHRRSVWSGFNRWS